MAQHELHLAHRTLGHQTVTWDPEVVTEEGTAAVEEAERIFRENVEQNHFLAYTVDPVTKEAEQVFAFDASAPRIVIMPVAAGG